MDQVCSDNGKGYGNTLPSKSNLTLLHSFIQSEYSQDGFYYSWFSEESSSLPHNFVRLGMAFDGPGLPPPIPGCSPSTDVHGNIWHPTLRILKHIISHLTIVTYKSKVCKCDFNGIWNCCTFVCVWRVNMSWHFKVRNDVNNAYP